MIEAPTEPVSPSLQSPIQVQLPYVSINGILYVDLKDWEKTDLDKTFISAADVTRYVNQNTRGIRKSCVLSSSPTKHLIAVNSLIEWVSKNRDYLGRRHHARRQLAGAAATPHARRLEREKGLPPAATGEQREGKPAARQRPLTDAQVAEVRTRMARAASPDTQRTVIRELSKRFGSTEKTIRDCARGRTYKNLPMPEAQPKKPEKSGRKSKTAQAVEAASRAS